jgi:hypothetical protein
MSDTALSAAEAVARMVGPQEEATRTEQTPAAPLQRKPARAAAPPPPEEEEQEETSVDEPPEQEPIGDEEDDVEVDVEETQEEDDTPEAAAIDPPMSWTKAEKEAFAQLPPAVQQTIADRERQRDLTIRQSQNETAQIRKASDDARKQADELAKFYHESALPALQSRMQKFVNAMFPDIKTEADLQALRVQNPGRYLEFEALAREYAQDQQRQQQFQQQQQQAKRADLEKFRTDEVKLFLQAAPEYADPKRAPALHQEVRELFNSVGIPQEEMDALFGADGDGMISIHDHRAQLIIRDAARWRMAQKKAKAKVPASAPAPRVQKPGTAQTKGERRSAHVETLDKRLSRTGSREDAVALLRAMKNR